MRYFLLTAFVCIYCSAALQAQEKPPRVKKMRLSEIGIHAGRFSQNVSPGSLADFTILAPQSALVKKDLSGYTAHPYSYTFAGMEYSAFGSISFRDRSQTGYRNSVLLRPGISYAEGASLSAFLSKSEEKRFDTLRSARTDKDLIYLDSVDVFSQRMDYTYTLLRPSATLLYYAPLTGRISVLMGAGIAAA